jgi:hypothetical protein
MRDEIPPSQARPPSKGKYFNTVYHMFWILGSTILPKCKLTNFTTDLLIITSVSCGEFKSRSQTWVTEWTNALQFFTCQPEKENWLPCSSPMVLDACPSFPCHPGCWVGELGQKMVVESVQCEPQEEDV